MSLSNFFRINLPYGMRKNDQGEWSCFNREYVPLGFNNLDQKYVNLKFKKTPDYPVSTKYGQLTDKYLRKLIDKYDLHSTADKSGNIDAVWFYRDSTNPSSEHQANYYPRYFNILKQLSKLKPSDFKF